MARGSGTSFSVNFDDDKDEKKKKVVKKKSSGSNPGQNEAELNAQSKFRTIKKGTVKKYKGSRFRWNGKRWIEEMGAWKDLGRGIKKKIIEPAKERSDKRKSETIGRGSESNPEFTRHPRTGALKKNPNFKPPSTKVASSKSQPFKYKSSDTGIQVAGKTVVSRGKDDNKSDKNDGAIRKLANDNKQTTASTDKKQETEKKPTPTTVHTRHYKTGKPLGVMTRAQRRAYEKEAGTKTWESEVAKHHKDKNTPKHLKETKYKASLRKKLKATKKKNKEDDKKNRTGSAFVGTVA